MNRDGQPFAPIARHFEVAEIFSSIQGESSLQGLPCSFVRFAGCGLRCDWCDTKYAFDGGEVLSARAILARVASSGLPLVCLTGGEPLDQAECGALAQAFLDEGFAVSVETGGFRDIGALPCRAKVIMDVKCPGSGMERRNRWQNLAKLLPGDELKFVVRDETDYTYARTVLHDHPLPDDVAVLVSPVHGELDPRDLIGWLIRDKLRARVNLQLHKYVWGPEATGV
ncbi:MAG: radical SAM protein [Deltaproteobacteria bacterium]|nr:radical SAM protein [Deltaproteobacteria bacterium]